MTAEVVPRFVAQRRGPRILLRRLSTVGSERGVAASRSFIQSSTAPLASSIFSRVRLLSPTARMRMENVIPILSRSSLSGPSPKKVIALAATSLARRNVSTIDGLGSVVDSASIAVFAKFAKLSSSSIPTIQPHALFHPLPLPVLGFAVCR